MMDGEIRIISTTESQPVATPRGDDSYIAAYASNLKRSREFGKFLGSFDLHLPQFDLYLHCCWRRNDRGDEYIDLPKTKVVTPAGHTHLKRLVRFATAAAD